MRTEEREILFVQPQGNAELLAAYGIGDQPLPVAREDHSAIFDDGLVRLDRLLEAVHACVVDDPASLAKYAASLSGLAYLVGVTYGGEGDPAAATYYLGLGLDADPANLSLRLHRAWALYLEGRREESLLEFGLALSDPDLLEAPLATALAARVAHECGERGLAAELARHAARSWPTDPGFWDFLAELDPPRESPSAATARAKRLRPRLEAVRRRAAESRGSHEERPEPQHRFCGDCGGAMPSDASFCGSCGAPRSKTKQPV